MIRFTDPHTFLNAKAVAGAGTALNVSDFRHIIVAIATDGGSDAALTCKAQGSIGKGIGTDTGEPTWASAQSVTNHYDFIALSDYQDATIVPGDTGFVVATADDYRLFEVNTNGLKWLNFRVTARTEGEVTVWALGYTNQ